MKSLYIHIPFCESKCYYCDFCSFKADDNIKNQYVAKLLCEIDNLPENITLKSVFIGGGTPSLLDIELVKQIFTKIKSKFLLCDNCEITIECNPNSLTEDKMKAYKELGINRLSIGVQTLNDELLKEIGRVHTKQDFLEVAGLIPKYFQNYNFDLMIGLPNQTKKDIESTIKECLSFNPTHISLYSLILEPNTKLEQQVKNGEVNLPNEDEVTILYDQARKLLEDLGFSRYEISNFCKQNFESVHNFHYWQSGEYYGVGLSAHSFINGVRYYNTSNMQDYISGNFEPIYKEELTTQEQITEHIMLELRTAKGLNHKNLKNKFNYDILLAKEEALKEIASFVEINDTFIKIKDDSFYVSDSIILKLL